MDETEISKKLEFYSNAIVVFIVFQGLTFCYTFGTNVRFNEILKANKPLSVGLAVLFFLAMVLAFFANHFLRQELVKLSGKYGQLVKVAYLGKSVIVGLFGIFPVIITVRYAIFNA